MSKTILITGASKGIGLALAGLFTSKGFLVTGTSRSGNRIPGLTQIEMISLDLADSNSIKKAAKALAGRGQRFDMLINNAAVGTDLEMDMPDEESFRKTFEVNVTGTVLFTESVVNLLEKGGKLINISSKMGSTGSCSSANAVAYRMSKAALNMYSKILANRYSGLLSVATLHPGWVRTSISKGNVNAPLSPADAAVQIAAFALSDFPTGIYWDASTQSVIPW